MKVKKKDLKAIAQLAEAFSQFIAKTPDVAKAIMDESVNEEQEIELTEEQAKAIGLADDQQNGVEDYLNDKFKS
jgi:hypothetical protein